MAELSILDTSTSSCNVCHLPMQREQIHYGASCCFSCRAFFRRNSLKGSVAGCKLDDKCLISFIDRKSCTPCRFEKCLRVGMKKEYITRGHRKRLRRSYKLENGDVQPIFQDLEEDCQLMNNIGSDPVKTSISEVQVNQIHVDPPLDTAEIHVIIGSNDVLEDVICVEDESQIDPDTGEITTDMKTKNQQEEKVEDFVTENYENEYSEVNLDHHFIIESVEREFENEKRLCSEHIINYIHKKFNKTHKTNTLVNNIFPHQNMNIQNVKLSPKSENTSDNFELSITAKSAIPLQQNRKSVIVKRTSVIQTLAPDFSSDRDEEVNIVLSLNIHDLEQIYTFEESAYIGQVMHIFEEKWNSITLDERTLLQTIHLCESGINSNVPMEYFRTINVYLKERLLNFLFSLNDLESLSSDRQFHLMRCNMSKIHMLVQVLSYSLKDLDAELSLMFSKNDLNRLRQLSTENQQMTITELTKWAPIPNNQKQMYITRMRNMSNPFLKDKKIFVLMLMILLFEDKSDPSINNISEQYWTMLKRYLNTRTEILDINNAIGALEKFKMSL